VLGSRPRPGEEARSIHCRSNLNQLAKGMATYLNELGNDTWYPFPVGRGLQADDFNGAEWLASLYCTNVVPDPGVFLCPSSSDFFDSHVECWTNEKVDLEHEVGKKGGFLWRLRN